MSEILGNIYDRSAAMVFGTAFLVLLGDCVNLLFDENVLFIFKKKVISRTGSRKTSITQGWLVVESTCRPLIG